MKRHMIWVIVTGILACLAIMLLYRHFVTDRIMDKGGMENPKPVEPLDGNYTYVANEILMELIAGKWVSTDGRWELTILDDYGIVLTLDGGTVLDDMLEFTYLQPGVVACTEFHLASADYTLKWKGGSSVAGIDSFSHEASDADASGRIVLRLRAPGEETVTEEVVFHKQRNQT